MIFHTRLQKQDNFFFTLQGMNHGRFFYSNKIDFIKLCNNSMCAMCIQCMHSHIVVFKFQTKVYKSIRFAYKTNNQYCKPDLCKVELANKMHFIPVIWSVPKWTIKICTQNKCKFVLTLHLYKNTKTVIL